MTANAKTTAEVIANGIESKWDHWRSIADREGQLMQDEGAGDLLLHSYLCEYIEDKMASVLESAEARATLAESQLAARKKLTSLQSGTPPATANQLHLVSEGA